MRLNPMRLAVTAAALLTLPAVSAAADAAADGSNTAWILTSTALVLFMTLPGLALFYGGLVRSIARSQTSDFFEAEDAAQEILLTAFRSIDGFRGTDERTFLAWFFRVANNRLRNLATWFAAAKRRQPEAREAHRTSPSSAAAAAGSCCRRRRSTSRICCGSGCSSRCTPPC
mgnify:CR=1 FL=1